MKPKYLVPIVLIILTFLTAIIYIYFTGGIGNILPETGISKTTIQTTPVINNFYSLIERNGGILPTNLHLSIPVSTTLNRLVSPASNLPTVITSWFDITDNEYLYSPFNPMAVGETRQYSFTTKSDSSIKSPYFEIKSYSSNPNTTLNEWFINTSDSNAVRYCDKDPLTFVIKCKYPQMMTDQSYTVKLDFKPSNILDYRQLVLASNGDGATTGIYGWWYIGITKNGTERSDLLVRATNLRNTYNRSWPISVSELKVRLIQISNLANEGAPIQYTFTNTGNIDIENVTIIGLFNDLRFDWINCPGPSTDKYCIIPHMIKDQTYQIVAVPQSGHFQNLVVAWNGVNIEPTNQTWAYGIGFINFNW